MVKLMDSQVKENLVMLYRVIWTPYLLLVDCARTASISIKSNSLIRCQMPLLFQCGGRIDELFLLFARVDELCFFGRKSHSLKGIEPKGTRPCNQTTQPKWPTHLLCVALAGTRRPIVDLWCRMVQTYFLVMIEWSRLNQ